MNAPGQVSFYLDALIMVCTFDPIPTDIIYEFMPLWNFDKVSVENNNEFFSRIGLEDRNIISVMGSLILIVFVFMIIRFTFYVLNPLANFSHRIRKVLAYVRPEAALRTVIVMVLLETYLDLSLGGLLNTENDELLDDSTNWGLNGTLTSSD